MDSIIKSAKQDANGIKWISNMHKKSTDSQIKVYNLSLSHGMSSTISFLSELALIKKFRKDCIHLLKKSTNYILSYELPKSSKSLFPNRILEDGSADQNSRLAWCYGDFGIGLALLKASKVLKDEELREKALFILEHTTCRKVKKDTFVIDAAICHGAFGNAQIYTFLYNETKNELYKESARYWIQYGMNMSVHDDGYAGFKQWEGNSEEWSPKTSLLEGIAGIGLSIIDYLSEEPNTWDKCILLH